ncbi:hypothetical protein BDQ17DRAFT_643567 [Cyathus striatus]|nr:hypothetical protein BDQ17DRAFT_1041100 [Cyathus striatus]KAF8986569.1 hypothetical protein BDQ17DRAFT_643567 [Cyathus striatus]
MVDVLGGRGHLASMGLDSYFVPSSHRSPDTARTFAPLCYPVVRIPHNAVTRGRQHNTVIRVRGPLDVMVRSVARRGVLLIRRDWLRGPVDGSSVWWPASLPHQSFASSYRSYAFLPHLFVFRRSS